MNVIMFLSIAFLSYAIAQEIINKKMISKVNNYIMIKNEVYYNQLLKYYENNKKVKLRTRLNIIHRINILLDRAFLKRNILINPVTIIVMCIGTIFISYLITNKVFDIPLLSFVIALPTGIFPIAIISLMANYNDQKLEKTILNFLLQLKNYTKINNDIVYAFREVKITDPLQSYIDKFLIEINRGVKFEISMEHLKEKIHLKSFNELLNHIEFCYLYGGNFSELISKSYQTIEEMQREKENRIQETRGARAVLVILILLDLIVYFAFINSNAENYRIMKTTFFGNVILYWNFISMWLLMLLSHNVKKLDY